MDRHLILTGQRCGNITPIILFTWNFLTNSSMWKYCVLYQTGVRNDLHSFIFKKHFILRISGTLSMRQEYTWTGCQSIKEEHAHIYTIIQSWWQLKVASPSTSMNPEWFPCETLQRQYPSSSSNQGPWSCKVAMPPNYLLNNFIDWPSWMPRSYPKIWSAF